MHIIFLSILLSLFLCILLRTVPTKILFINFQSSLSLKIYSDGVVDKQNQNNFKKAEQMRSDVKGNTAINNDDISATLLLQQILMFKNPSET